jgi:hypothetical protein
MPVDLARLGTPEEPPPKGAWWLVDRDIPASGVGIKLDEIPRIVGHVFLFGKQTDRAARLELISFRPELAEGQAVVKEVVGDALGAAGPEVVAEQAPAITQMLSWNWRLPDDTPPAMRLELINAQRSEILMNRWPELPQKVLGGKSAVQAAADPASRIKVLATLLLLELATDQSSTDFDFNELRKKLGLPTVDPVDPTTTSAIALPLVRLSRVDAQKLKDEELLRLYQMADHFRHVAALRKLAAEVIARPSLDKQLDKAEVYGILAQIEPDTDKAVDYLDLARKTAEANKTSTAPWDLAELGMRLARGEVAEADRLLHHIRNDHMREPGVAQALFQILSQAGIIGPDGRPTAAAAAGREGSGIVVPGAAAAEPGKIWTPGGDQPAGGKKSALWTPDMD